MVWETIFALHVLNVTTKIVFTIKGQNHAPYEKNIDLERIISMVWSIP